MSLTFTDVRRSNGGNRYEVSAAVAFDSAYPTGGEPVNISELGLSILDELRVASGTLGYMTAWDGSKTAPKILVYQGDNTAGAASPGVQIGNGVSLAALTGVRIVAIGV